MLQVENRFMIQDLYRRGMSISEIARVTGHDRKTVRAIINSPLSVAPRKRKVQASKLDPFVPFLERRIEEGVLNCTKLLAELREQGYEGGKSLVKYFVQPYRETRRQEATVRFETAPGEQAQVDWGHFGFIEHYGHRRRLYAFVMTLGWSRVTYLEFMTSVDAACWLRGHVHAFRYFGGVPQVVLHDNLKTAVLKREADGTVHWNPRYLDFAHYYGFTPRACRQYRAQTKGKVESGVRYVRGNFWPGLRFTDLSDLNRQAWEWLAGTANVRIHGTTHEVPFARLPFEPLQPLDGKPDYDASLISFRRATKDCFVSYEGNYYSVPSECIRKVLELRETEDELLLVFNAQDEEVARHRLLHGQGLRSVEPAHYAQVRYRAGSAKRAVAVQVLAKNDWCDVPPPPEVEARPLDWYDQVVEA